MPPARKSADACVLLDATTVVPYLIRRGHIVAGEDARVTELGGGVSNVVLAIDTDANSYVLKQALPRLRVAEEWLAPQERALSEAAALELAGRISPGAVPRVVDCDPTLFTVLMARAPLTWSPWKSLLLAGTLKPEVGARLGSLLAAWHNSTDGGAGLDDGFRAVEPFERLRVDPYYRTVARRVPALAADIAYYVCAMQNNRTCLVHGDFSPKNVLVGPRSPQDLWVIDFEVAHLGDPAFDVAFLLSHLLLKSILRPAWSDRYLEIAQNFVSAYAEKFAGERPLELKYVCGHVGCLVAARVDGKSPVEYLFPAAMQTARDLAFAILRDPPASATGLWSLLAEQS